MRQDDRSLVVVVPMYNEELNVQEFFSRLGSLTDDCLKGVVVVDDGSTDQTVTLIERLFESYPVPIRLVRLSRNFGHQSAVLAGCREGCKMAEELDASWVGVIDGDLQDRPEDFTLLLDHATEYDVVYAVRAQRHDGWIMKNIAPVFYDLLSRNSRYPIPRNAGTFSVLRTPVAMLIAQSADPDPYFPGLRAWAGFRQRGVPIDRQARAQGDSKVALKGLVRLSLRAIFLHSDIPIRLILGAAGGFFAVLGCVALVVLFLRLSGMILPTGVTTIIMLQIFSMGLIAMFFSVIAFMILRVKSNTSRQRQWVVMEQLDSRPRGKGLHQ